MQFSKKRGLFEAGRIIYIKPDDIAPNPNQPRKYFEATALRELANSISRYGIMQPLSVRRQGSGYELVSGERRLRAAKIAELKEVPCIVLDVTAPDSSVLALVENLQRRDLDFIEEAEGLARLIELHGMSQEEAARKVGKSQSAVANKLRILKLQPEILFVIRDAGLTERHARALLRLPNEDERVAVLSEVVKQGLNVAKTEEYIEAFLAEKDKPAKDTKEGQKPLYILKDVRLFLNTITRSLSIMKDSGIDAQCGRADTDTDIILTIKIPKQ